jgi:hypothetical protein
MAKLTKHKFALIFLSLLLLVAANSAQATGLRAGSCSSVFEFQAAEVQNKLENLLLTAELPPFETWVRIGNSNDQVYRVDLAKGFSVVWREAQGKVDYEVAAYQVDKLFKFNVVPVTIHRKFGTREGSVQYFMKGLVETDVPVPPKLMIFDFLIAQNDRGFGHNFVMTKENEPVAYDHEYTFELRLEDVPITLSQLKTFTTEGGYKELLERIRSTPASEIRKKLTPFLGELVDGVIERRDFYVKSVLKNQKE